MSGSGCAHPGFDRAKRMLDRAAAKGQRIGITAQPLPGSIDEILVLPPVDPSLAAGGASAVEQAGANGSARKEWSGC